MRSLMTLGAVFIAAAAPAASDKVPAVEEIGAPVDCIRTTSIRSTHVRSDSVIDFEMAGGQVYRNTLPQSCPSLGFEQRFAHESTLNQYCSVDTITVLYSTGMMRGATCGLGQFQPVKLVKAAK